MYNHLPLEILGLVSPFLCYAEGHDLAGLPSHWRRKPQDVMERIFDWLQRDLPTYSFDNLDDIVEATRDFRRLEPLEAQNARYWWRWWRRKISAHTHQISPPPGFDLVHVLRLLAAHYFQWAENELCIRNGKLVELHELGRRFPVINLVRFCHVEAYSRGYLSLSKALQRDPQLQNMHSISAGLRGIVQQGVSEGHLHLHSIFTPHESWADHIMQASPKASIGSNDPQFNRLITLGRYLVQLLCLGLVWEHAFPSQKTPPPFDLLVEFDQLYQTTNFHNLNCKTDAFLKKLEHFKSVLLKNLTLTENIMYLLRQKGPIPLLFPQMPVPNKARNWFYQNNIPQTKAGIRGHLLALDQLQFDVMVYLVRENKWSDEITFSHGPSQRIPRPFFAPSETKEKPLRHFLNEAFFRYLVLHTHYWQLGTQGGYTTGLRNFQLFLDSKQRHSLSEWTESKGFAFERMCSQRSLKAVEGRLKPQANYRDLIPWILAFTEQRRQKTLDKFGFVIHFTKDDKYKGPGARMNPFNINQVRFARARRRTRHHAIRLFRTLSTPSYVTPFIVGIDAANLELMTPPEVFAPSFRFLREFPIELRQNHGPSEYFGRFQPIFDVVNQQRLGMTFHVGEDFRHLLSGLRAIDEVLLFLNPIPGDRLGHATALAISPKTWVSQIGYQALVSKGEWLDTLVWVHHLLGGAHPAFGDLQINDRIQRLSREIYHSSHHLPIQSQFGHMEERRRLASDIERDWSIATLYDAWRLRQLDPYCADVAKLNNNQFTITGRMFDSSNAAQRWLHVQSRVLKEVDQYIGSNAAYKLLGLYWYNPDVRRRSDQITSIDLKRHWKSWLQVFVDAQVKMQDRVASRQMVIEANPTSNRLIGPMQSFDDHYIFSLAQEPSRRQGDHEESIPHTKRNIRVTINTDNPGAIGTSLTHEYYLLAETALKTHSEPVVSEWMEWLRQNGVKSSFLKYLPDFNSPEGQAFLKELRSIYRPILNKINGKTPQYTLHTWLQQWYGKKRLQRQQTRKQEP